MGLYLVVSLVGPYLVVSLVGWTVGIQKHPDSPILLIHCQDVKKVPQPSGGMSWIKTPQPVGTPEIPVLGASNVAHTSQGSPSIDVLPPDEGVVLADVDSVGCMRSTSGSQASCRTMTDDDGSGMGVSSGSVSSAVTPFLSTMLRIDGSCVLHPFSLPKLDAGPIRLMTIAHAFNYRIAVLRDGVKSALRVGRSRKAAGRFLMDTDLLWGQQVAVMFQIISTLTLEVPSFLRQWRKYGACLLMYNWTVNRGVIWTIVMGIVFVCVQIGRRLMFMIWPSCLGSLSCLQPRGMFQFIPR